MMESRRSFGGRKRSTRSPEAGYWDCSVCTFRNNTDAFKCDMCDVRKGTSTRKPRLNAQVVAQQRAQELMIPQVLPPKLNLPPRKDPSRIGAHKKSHSGGKRSRPRFKNVDRSSAITTEVVVNDVPVIITEYKEKAHTKNQTQIDTSPNSKNQLNGSME